MSISIADSSFLIDWARFSKRGLLFDVFQAIFVPETVMAELKTELVLSWIIDALSLQKMMLFPDIPELRAAALNLVVESRRYSYLKSLDYPEAYCIVAARANGYTVLSENGGAYLAQFFTVKDVKVWRAFEVLVELLRLGKIVKDFLKYQEETNHKFPKRDLEKVFGGNKDYKRKHD